MLSVPIEMICALMLGATFARSAIPKILEPDRFVLAVYQYRIAPLPLAYAYARALPPVELVAAALLLTGIASRLGALLCSGMIVTFLVAVLVNLARGNKVRCNCFGSGGREIGWRLVAEDLGLLILSVIVLFSSKGWLGIEDWSVLRLPSAGGIAGLAVATAGILAAVASAASWGGSGRRAHGVSGKEGAIWRGKHALGERTTSEGRGL